MKHLHTLSLAAALLLGTAVHAQTPADAFFSASVADTDKDIAAVLSGELKRQHEALLKLVNVSREESLRRFVTTEMLQAVESRIVTAIERLGDRLDNVIDGHRRGG